MRIIICALNIGDFCYKSPIAKFYSSPIFHLVRYVEYKKLGRPHWYRHKRTWRRKYSQLQNKTMRRHKRLGNTGDYVRRKDQTQEARETEYQRKLCSIYIFCYHLSIEWVALLKINWKQQYTHIHMKYILSKTLGCVVIATYIQVIASILL